MNQHGSKSRLGMSIIAGGLAFVGTADATELLLDGSFENTSNTSNPLVKVGGKANPGVGGGWSVFSTYLYSSQYAMPGPASSGQAFLRPYASGTYGITQSSEVVTQAVSLITGTTLTPAKIDGGSGRYNMSAWFSSYLTQGDSSDLTLQFLDESDNPIDEPIALGGPDFVAAIPTGVNSKYSDAKDWAQDVRTGSIPVGARKALVTVSANEQRNGAPDGYVDLVSLDVTDAALSFPALVSATPANDAVGAGPVVTIGVTLQDRVTAVATNTIRMFLDNISVSPTIQKLETNTTVTYVAGILPALSRHEYAIVFGDTGTPSTSQTNRFQFTVADYLTIPDTLRSPLGSEDSTKPGFEVLVYQLDTLLEGELIPTQEDIPPSIAFAEAVLAGIVGPNVANLDGSTASNLFNVPGTINWVNSSGATANFADDRPFPAIPGISGSEASFVHEIRTYVRFPAAGYYEMGVNNEDHFRLSLATSGHQVLTVSAPTNMVIPSVPIATNINQLQFGGSLPATPLTAPIIYATPGNNPEDACNLSGNTALAGKIVLLDRGAASCNDAAKALQAQQAGAVAVLEITPDDPGYPFRLGDISTEVKIPVLVIGEEFGGKAIKSSLSSGQSVTATIQADPNTTITEWDGPKGFGAVSVMTGFAVPMAGVYPMRLVAGQEAGAANLEWFSIQPDGTKILINDTTNPNALRTFRARTFAMASKFNPAVASGGNITLSWTGSGTLQEATSLGGTWSDSSNQSNPQTVPVSGSQKFYRIRQ